MLLPPPHPQIGDSRFDPLGFANSATIETIRRLGLAAPRRSPAELWAAQIESGQQVR
jgi:hypothetical protein